jgi:hypothetical protein
MTMLAGLMLITAQASAPAPPADFAAGAEACIAALQPGSVDGAALRQAGWAVVRSGETPAGHVEVFGRDDSRVQLFASAMGHCVVDGLASGQDQFDPIRDAIRERLAARFGTDFSLTEATGSGSARGQGYRVGDRMAVLSSQMRPNGLSLRFTSMRFPGQ